MIDDTDMKYLLVLLNNIYNVQLFGTRVIEMSIWYLTSKACIWNQSLRNKYSIFDLNN